MQNLEHLTFGLFYGTDTGNTEEIGDKICDEFAGHDISVNIQDIANSNLQQLSSYDVIILGIPTWDFGGIQEDWEMLEGKLDELTLEGKIVALYGLGDQLGYGDYFVDAMGWLHDYVVKAGALVIGEWPTEGYDFEASLACNDDKSLFCGLAVDEDQQIELTDGRVTGWVEQLLGQLSDIFKDLKHG